MTEQQSQSHPSRRDVLKFLAAAGVTAIGGYALYEYAPWQNYDQKADQTRLPFETNLGRSAQMQQVVRFASLAASGHNTQPWKFAVTQNAIEIHPDPSRHLPAVDPNNRELWISLGCALENLLIAARAAGFLAQVSYPNATDFIRVDLTTDTSQKSALFDAIPERQNTRSMYDGKPLERKTLNQLQSLPLEPGINLHFELEAAGLETVLEYVNQGNLIQYANKDFLNELIAWVRFTKKEALASGDGLYSGASGNPQVPRWLGQMVVEGIKPQAQADSDAKKLRSSSGAVLVTSESDDKTAWVRTGQVYERLALEMTSLNIKSAFLNQPIEVAEVRAQFQSALKLETALPQLLVRFGHAEPMPKSLRRPLQDVLL
jgi:hypothetical protein